MANNEHETIALLLPWQVNGRLSEDESRRVETHLQNCQTCREQVLQLQTLKQHVVSEPPAWQPSAQHFSQLLASVEHLKQAAPNNHAQQQPSIRKKTWQELFKGFLQMPATLRWTMALESVALVVLVAYLSVPAKTWLATTDNPYQTLSDGTSQHSTTDTVVRIRLLFQEQITAAEITQLLKQADANIQEGPSELGFFFIEVPQNRAAQVLDILRNNPGVRLAEPVQ